MSKVWKDSKPIRKRKINTKKLQTHTQKTNTKSLFIIIFNLLFVNDNLLFVTIVLVLFVGRFQEDIVRFKARVDVLIDDAFAFRRFRSYWFIALVCCRRRGALFEVDTMIIIFVRASCRHGVGVDLVEPLFCQSVHRRLTVSQFLILV